MKTNMNEIGINFLTMKRRVLCSRSVQLIVTTMAFCLLAVGCSASMADAAGPVEQQPNRTSVLTENQEVAAPSTIKANTLPARGLKRSNFKRERVSIQARQVADWIVDSRDNRRMPFAIIDKTWARIYVFNEDGLLRGAAYVLLGSAYGDYSVPGIGNRKLSSIRPEERTTPAGRFVASLGRNLSGEDILWVDYDAAISLHRVITNNPGEHRLQRLATTTLYDKRISYGCINVSANFFDKVVRRVFSGTNGIVYVLPDTKLLRDFFAMHDVEERAPR